MYAEVFKLLTGFHRRYHAERILRIQGLCKLNYTVSVLCAENEVYPVYAADVIRSCLGVAAGDGYDGIGIEIYGTAYHLAGFSVAKMGYGTCVYHVHVSRLRKIYRFIACIFKKLLHCFGFILVDLAAESIKSGFFHNFCPFL